jgi:hypothetical protein
VLSNISARIGLDKYVEGNQITSDPDELKIWSPEDKYLAETSLHPQEGHELTASLSHTRIHLQLADFN